ncbi:MAG TPA: hypothetical protein VGR00_01540 [Thermoanaerobaculia bacterium]|jgi:hypothetical protein|nr:hypothetical protein [Thermoanaerobaculia bacterium]
MALDDKVRAHLRELGAALNEAVSGSSKVHEILAKVRAEGFDAYLVLDATVALDRRGRRASASLPSIRRGALPAAAEEGEGAPFQINVKDLRFLRSVGIDPTRPIRARRRPGTGTTVTMRSTVAKRG